MSQAIVRSDVPVTLLGAGRVEADDLALALSHAPVLVAADGGAAHALDRGLMPRAVIGDMDSMPDAVRQAIPADRLHKIEEQDSTDFDKALCSIAAPLVLGVGFLGDRLDHQLAAMSALVRQAAQRCILIGAQ